MSSIVPVMIQGGNVSATTAAVGTNWVAFTSQSCRQLAIVNTSGTDIEFRQDSAGVTVTVVNGTVLPLYGLNNASQIEVRRLDTTNVQVTVKARWEG